MYPNSIYIDIGTTLRPKCILIEYMGPLGYCNETKGCRAYALGSRLS